MHAWEQIQLTVDYIEEHMEESFEIEKLAKMAALSPFYYQRLFSRLVKKPVMEYIKLRRLAKATEVLLQKNTRILDVALELGFHSHEHFTKTFKEIFGITPGEYRNNPKVLNRLTKPQLLLNYTLIEEGEPIIVDNIVLEVNRRKLENLEEFIGYKKKMPVQFVEGLGIESGEDPLANLWNTFHEEKEKVGDLLVPKEEIGVAYPDKEEGYFNYFVGAKVKTNEKLNHYEYWKMEEGEYIICSLEAENFEALVMDVLYKAQQYLFSTWLPNHKLCTEPFCVERYKTHDSDTTSMELWLKIKSK